MNEGLLLREDLGDRTIAPHLKWLLDSRADLLGIAGTDESRKRLSRAQDRFFREINAAGVVREVAEIGLALHEAAPLQDIAGHGPRTEENLAQLEYDLIVKGQETRMREILQRTGIGSRVSTTFEVARRLGNYAELVRRVAAWTDNT